MRSWLLCTAPATQGQLYTLPKAKRKYSAVARGKKPISPSHGPSPNRGEGQPPKDATFGTRIREGGAVVLPAKGGDSHHHAHLLRQWQLSQGGDGKDEAGQGSGTRRQGGEEEMGGATCEPRFQVPSARVTVS